MHMVNLHILSSEYPKGPLVHKRIRSQAVSTAQIFVQLLSVLFYFINLGLHVLL